MLTKRIIPCLDVKDGRTVKGINFEGLRDAGDAVELAARYANEGADELVFLDITATLEKRKTLVDLVKKVAKELNIPFTVGGGVNTIEDVSAILLAGADKVSVNSAAVKNPALVDEIAKNFGSQCLVIAVDTKKYEDSDKVHIHGGKTPTDKHTFNWIKEVQERGAGEILLTSMDKDGTKDGFEVGQLKKINSFLEIPIIASGGAGNMQHFKDVFLDGEVDAALAASIFHFGEVDITALKKYLQANNIPIRLNN